MDVRIDRKLRNLNAQSCEEKTELLQCSILLCAESANITIHHQEYQVLWWEQES